MEFRYRGRVGLNELLRWAGLGSVCVHGGRRGGAYGIMGMRMGDKLMGATKGCGNTFDSCIFVSD